jgi:cytochrome c-type biogenesis protein CcmH
MRNSQTPSDDDVNAIAKQLYCPICENTPLDVCPTKACADWREQIRQKLNEVGLNNRLKIFLPRNNGDSVLADPPRNGIKLAGLF